MKGGNRIPHKCCSLGKSRSLGQLLLLLQGLQIVVALLAALQSPAAAAAAAGTVTTAVTVSTEAQLLSALGTPSVAVIRMAADIVVRADSVIPGADPASGVYRLTRNVNITAADFVDWFPALNVAAIKPVPRPMR